MIAEVTSPRSRMPVASAQPAEIGASDSPVRAKHLKKELAGVVQRAFGASHRTQSQLAADIGTQHQFVSRWGDASAPHAPTILHLAAAPAEFARPLIDWLAERHGLEVLAQAAVVHGDDNAARMNAVARACANLPRALAGLESQSPTLEQLDLFEREATTCAEVAREVKAYAVDAKRRAREASR